MCAPLVTGCSHAETRRHSRGSAQKTRHRSLKLHIYIVVNGFAFHSLFHSSLIAVPLTYLCNMGPILHCTLLQPFTPVANECDMLPLGNVSGELSFGSV